MTNENQENSNKLYVSEQLILHMIFIFRDRNENEDNENMQQWTVIQNDGGYNVYGVRDFAIIKEALAERFDDLLATAVQKSVAIEIRKREADLES